MITRKMKGRGKAMKRRRREIESKSKWSFDLTDCSALEEKERDKK